MRTPGLSPLDDELLSAYVDGALSQAERAALEQRLSADSLLSAELADVRRTKAILRAAPELAPPRNFTLDPARYNRSSSRRMLPIRWLRVGVALVAAILLIAFVVITRTPATNSAGSLVALAPSASPAPVMIVPGTAASNITSAAKVAASNTLPPIPTLTPSVVLMQAAVQNAVAATTAPSPSALRAVPTVNAPAPLAFATSPSAAFTGKQTPIRQTPMAASAAQLVPSAPLAGIQSSSDAQSGENLLSILIALIRRLLMSVGL